MTHITTELWRGIMDFKEGIIQISKEDLAYLASHKCRFCEYSEARCSQATGCYEGILEYLRNKENELRNSES
jgi:hypothetical protein